MNCKECEWRDKSELAGRDVCAMIFSRNHGWTVKPEDGCKWGTNEDSWRKKIDHNPRNFIKRLKEIYAGKPHTAIARAVGVNQETIYKWMDGVNVPAQKTMQEILDRLGMDIPEFYGGNKDEWD